MRGINVCGRNLLPMKTLAAMFDAAGCTRVRTYIQSGNVVFTAPPALARTVGATIQRAIRTKTGIESPVIVRSAPELGRVATGNPFLAAGAPPETLHVAFLADEPGAARVAVLDPARSPPDELVVRGRDIFLRLPNGVARTKLTNAYFDSKLGTTSTLRNWRTVLTLTEMAADSQRS